MEGGRWDSGGVRRAGGGGRRVGFHALHYRMLSCMEGIRGFVCLSWVRFPALCPRVWAGGLSVAVWLVVGGVAGMAGVWAVCGRDLHRWRGGALRAFVGRGASMHHFNWV